MPSLLVHWHGSGMIHLSYGLGHSPDGMPLSGYITLMPGINAVDSDRFDQATKGHPTCESYMKGRNPKLKVLEKVKTVSEALKGMNVDEAIEVVGDCVVRETLEKWLDTEKRRKVRDAIVEQLKSITITDADREKASEKDDE